MIECYCTAPTDRSSSDARGLYISVWLIARAGWLEYLLVVTGYHSALESNANAWRKKKKKGSARVHSGWRSGACISTVV